MKPSLLQKRKPSSAAIAASGLAGLAGGLLASWLMVKFQQSIWPPPTGDRGSSTAKLAKDVIKWTGAAPLTNQQARHDGTRIHYALGAGLGLAYGAAAVVNPRITLAGGVLFGVATELVIDQAIVPALGLANPFWKCPVKWHVRGLAAHIVFGTATEATRRLTLKLSGTPDAT